jgi:hypothetical protein
MGNTKKNSETVPGQKPPMNTRTTQPVGQKTAGQKNAGTKNTAAKNAPAKKPAGRLLHKEPIEVPRRPDHHYGRSVGATAVAVGDVLYTGTQRHLSTVEVLDVRPEKANPDTYVLIETAAISLLLDGKEYVAGERVFLRAARDTLLAVRSGTAN